MRLVYPGNKANIRSAVAFVNELLDDPDFFSSIEAKDRFDESDYTGRQLADAMRDHVEDIRVVVKVTIYPSVNGWTKRNSPGVIFYSAFKTGRPTGEIVNTLVHELVHVVDHSQPGRHEDDFGHADNDSTGKENCAPNWIGDLAEKFYSAPT